jgi:hypothetical protein
MGSHDKVIEALESEGIKTEEEARRRLKPIALSNVRGVLGSTGGSLFGTANGSEKVLAHFKKKEKEENE